MTTMTKIKVAVFAYPGVQMSAVLGLIDVFEIANNLSARLNGVILQAQQIDKTDVLANVMRDFDVIILPPNLTGQRGDGEQEIREWLCRQHQQGSIMCSVCAGAFWLGNSGLLQGRPATTHWLLDDEFRKSFPSTQLNSEQILVDDNDIVTAGGIMAWLDLALYIVQRWQGSNVMSDTARQLLVDPSGREQRNYRSFRPVLNHGDDVILSLQHWMESNFNLALQTIDMVQQTGLSDRTLLRRFKKATGLTPNNYVQELRIEKARGLLERTRHSIAEIGWQVGYSDASAFSRLFKDVTGVSAGDYRKRFGVVKQRT